MPFDTTTSHIALSTSLADRYGRAKALLDAAQAEVDAIKAEIKAAGVAELAGDEFVITMTESLRETAALKAHLGEAYGRFTKVSYSQTIRVKAVAAARLQRAA